MRFTIEGAPRTKKNSLRRIKRGRRVFTVSSEAHEAWETHAVLQLQAQFPRVLRYTKVDRARGEIEAGTGPLGSPVNLRALVYRERGTGDLGNYLAAICDALERAGVVENDRLIGGFDGSRLLVDRERPRVEIELTPLTGA